MTAYFLRSRITGLYFNGTNFSAMFTSQAKPFLTEPVKFWLVWEHAIIERWEFPASSAIRVVDAAPQDKPNET